MTTDEANREIRDALQKLEVLFAQFSISVANLDKTVAALAAASVTREAHDNLAALVARNDADSRQRDKDLEESDEGLQKGIDANAKNWARLAWFVGLTVLGFILQALWSAKGGGS